MTVFTTARTTLILLTLSATTFMGCLPKVKATPAATASLASASAIGAVSTSLATPGLTLNPGTTSVAPAAAMAFVAAGGTPPYRYFLVEGSGSIDVNSGVYTALSVNGSAQIVVFDAALQSASAFIQIGTGGSTPPPSSGGGSATALAINPTNVDLGFGVSYTFAATGGTAPYSYHVIGVGTINASTGVYLAPATVTHDQVIVTDHAGGSVTVSVFVAPPMVPIWRSQSPTSNAHLYSLNGSEGPMGGWINEVAIVRVFEAAGVAGTVPIYRCVNQMSYFISLNVNCDGQKMESILGYIYPTAAEGSKPLNQFISPDQSDHYVTLNNASGSYVNYSLENLLGYAFDP